MKQDIVSRELNQRIASGESLRIVDVRSASEYASGHIPGAINLPLQSIGDQIPGVDATETLILVCQGGVRSNTACQKVQAKYPNLYNLVGGTSAWIAEGNQVDRGPKAPRSLDRQTHLVAGLLLISAFYLRASVGSDWIYLAALPTFGLMLDALTGICPMRWFLGRMPWNIA